MYPLRYMRGSLDTELRTRCADRHGRGLTCVSTRVSMGKPKAGGAPPERYSLSRQQPRRKDSDHEESIYGNCSGVRAREWSGADGSLCGRSTNRNDCRHGEGRSEEALRGLLG